MYHLKNPYALFISNRLYKISFYTTESKAISSITVNTQIMQLLTSTLLLVFLNKIMLML